MRVINLIMLQESIPMEYETENRKGNRLLASIARGNYLLR